MNNIKLELTKQEAKWLQGLLNTETALDKDQVSQTALDLEQKLGKELRPFITEMGIVPFNDGTSEVSFAHRESPTKVFYGRGMQKVGMTCVSDPYIHRGIAPVYLLADLQDTHEEEPRIVGFLTVEEREELFNNHIAKLDKFVELTN